MKRIGVTLDQLKIQLHASQYLAQEGSYRLEYVDEILEEGLKGGVISYLCRWSDPRLQPSDCLSNSVLLTRV